MKLKKTFISLISIVLLASCNEISSSISSTTSSSSTSSSSEIVDIKDVKSALEYMKNSYNFQVTTQNLSAITDMDYYWAYYTSTYYVGKFNTDNSEYEGYIQFDEGISRISVSEEDEIVYASELLSNSQDLYTNLLTRNLSNLDLNNISEGDSIEIRKKNDVVSLLSVMGFNSSTYVSLASNKLNLNYSKNILTITFSLNQATNVIDYEVLIECFGESSYIPVDEFIDKGGTYYVVNDDLSRIRTLFNNNNYIRNEYDENGEVVTSEYFTHQYYFNDISESYLTEYPTLASYYLGYVRIKKDNLKIGSYTTLNYDDVYMFMVSNRTEVQLVTRNNPDNEGYAQGAFTSRQDDITYVMNYPSRLLLWDELEKFDFDGTKYITEDYEIINDFISNFGITSSSETTLYANNLEIDYDLSKSDFESEVRLTLNCTDESGTEIVYNMNFSSFGSAYFEPVENFLDDYQIRIED